MKKKHTLFVVETISCVLLLIITTMTVSSYFILNKKPAYQIDFESKNFYVTTNNDSNQFSPGIELPVVDNSLNVTELVDNYILENKTVIDFYTSAFLLPETFISDKIKELNYEKSIFSKDDIFNTGTTYENFDEELFHYIMSLMNTNSEVFSNNIVPTYNSKEYIIGLIDYFAKYFPSVDTTIAKSIANIESGYTVRTMLDKNNIFGGLSNGYLISYKTIEYGVYSYLKLLNDWYFSLGLTTVESIGYKYNPVIENGIKIASPSWVIKVNSNLSLFTNATVTDIHDLLLLK